MGVSRTAIGTLWYPLVLVLSKDPVLVEEQGEVSEFGSQPVLNFPLA